MKSYSDKVKYSLLTDVIMKAKRYNHSFLRHSCKYYIWCSFGEMKSYTDNVKKSFLTYLITKAKRWLRHSYNYYIWCSFGEMKSYTDNVKYSLLTDLIMNTGKKIFSLVATSLI